MEDEIAKNIVPIIVMGTLGLFTFFGGVLLFIILYQKKVIRSQKEKQDLETQFQREMLHNYIETQENERQRIAADLHDNVGASLAAVKMMVNRIQASTEEQNSIINECKVVLQSTADSTRQISHDLLPPALETLGLKKVLQRIAKNISSEDFQMKITIDSGIKIPKKVELALFRITQEMTNNTIKYAEASVIEVKITSDAVNLFYSFCDNGKGFQEEDTKGLGLRNIRTRVEMIQGKHDFFSKANDQNGINVTIPHKI